MKKIIHYNLLLSLGLFASSLQSNAQTLFNVVGNTTIKVKPSEILFIQGGLSNSSSGIIDNEGTIYVSGDWENDNNSGGLLPTTGSVELNGGSQSIAGLQPTTFNNLSLTGTSASVKTLKVNTTVGGTSGVLSIGDDVMDLNGNVLTVSNAQPSAITKNSGYIKSETTTSPYSSVTWEIGTNSGTYSVPFGSGTGGNDVAIGITTNSGIGNGTFSFATYPTNASNMPFPSGITSLASAAADIADRYWIVDPKGYSLLPQISNLSFNYNDPNDIDPANNAGIVEADLQAIRYNTSQSVWMDYGPVGTINTASNNVTVASVSTANFFPVWTLVENTISTSVNKFSSKDFYINNVYQNNTGILQVQFTENKNEDCHIRLFDLLGKEIASKKIHALEGLNQTSLNLSDAGQSMYLLVLDNGKSTHTRKIVLNK